MKFSTSLIMRLTAGVSEVHALNTAPRTLLILSPDLNHNCMSIMNIGAYLTHMRLTERLSEVRALNTGPRTPLVLLHDPNDDFVAIMDKSVRLTHVRLAGGAAWAHTNTTDLLPATGPIQGLYRFLICSRGNRGLCDGRFLLRVWYTTA